MQPAYKSQENKSQWEKIILSSKGPNLRLCTSGSTVHSYLPGGCVGRWCLSCMGDGTHWHRCHGHHQGRWASSLTLRAVPWLQWAGTHACWGLGWPGQPDVPLLIITGIAFWAKLHLGCLRKPQGSARLLLDRLCNRIRNQMDHLDFTFSERLAVCGLGRLVL